MDLRCPKCGEPWDLDELHEVEGMSFDQAREAFYAKGCGVFGTRHSDNKAHPGVAMLYELLGNDVDGVAAMIEDFEALGMME